jgi:Flp pilus assembly pilin Flp
MPVRVIRTLSVIPKSLVMIKTYAYLGSLVTTILDRERGQTMAEYAVVLAVITIAILGALAFLSGGIKSALSSVTSKL